MVEKLCCLSVERVHSFLHINGRFLEYIFLRLEFLLLLFQDKSKENPLTNISKPYTLKLTRSKWWWSDGLKVTENLSLPGAADGALFFQEFTTEAKASRLVTDQFMTTP